jgi:hypothetical protein
VTRNDKSRVTRDCYARFCGSPGLRRPGRPDRWHPRYAEGEVSLADLATEYSVGRSTIHRIISGPDNPR